MFERKMFRGPSDDLVGQVKIRKKKKKMEEDTESLHFFSFFFFFFASECLHPTQNVMLQYGRYFQFK